jgi:5-methylcytosine-specific restriction endonuclease McrA
MHAGVMAMTACFDHLLPYSRGGATDLDNVILCCWPCNNGRGSLTLAEVGLIDPRERAPAPGPGWEAWDGLARFR